MSTFAIEEIGRALGARLGHYRTRNPLVVGLPPGGVPVAREISESLGGDFDFIQADALDFGGYRGAVAESGDIVLDAGGEDCITEREFAGHIVQQVSRMSSRRKLWARGSQAPDVAGRLVMVVADGLASGARMRAALVSLRERGANFLVAVAIAGTDRAVELVKPLADHTLCLMTSSRMAGVGRNLRDWKRIPRPAAFRLLAEAGRARSGRNANRGLSPSLQPAPG